MALPTKKDFTTGATQTYKVLQNLRANGKFYQPGATIVLNDKGAAPLLDRKVIELVPEASSAKGSK